jgi:hypothetical protein
VTGIKMAIDALTGKTLGASIKERFKFNVQVRGKKIDKPKFVYFFA